MTPTLLILSFSLLSRFSFFLPPFFQSLSFSSSPFLPHPFPPSFQMSRNTVTVPRHWCQKRKYLQGLERVGGGERWEKLRLFVNSNNLFISFPSLYYYYFIAKRGMEKSPFDLPDFIKDTGIQRIRDAYREKEDSKKAKQKVIYLCI